MLSCDNIISYRMVFQSVIAILPSQRKVGRHKTQSRKGMDKLHSGQRIQVTRRAVSLQCLSLTFRRIVAGTTIIAVAQHTLE